MRSCMDQGSRLDHADGPVYVRYMSVGEGSFYSLDVLCTAGHKLQRFYLGVRDFLGHFIKGCS